MSDGVRYDWVDCVCCASGKCCKMDSNEGVPFTPDEGFTLKQIDVSNSNVYGCVGRAVAEVILTKPANPGMGCQSGTCQTSGKCGETIPSTVFQKLKARFKSEWEAQGYEWLTSNESSGGYFGYPTCGNTLLPSQLTGCSKGEFRFNALSTDTTCPESCPGQSQSRKINLLKKTVNTGVLGCVNPTTYLNNTYWWPDMAAVNARLQADPERVVWTNPSTGYQCEYWMFGVCSTGQTLAYCPKCKYTTCWYYENIVWFSVPWVGMLWAVRCATDPCGGESDYNWPLVIPCVCTGEYDRPGIAKQPDCKLYLDSTRRGYADDQCLFVGRYVGAIEAGQITCPPGTNDPDCTCCGE